MDQTRRSPARRLARAGGLVVLGALGAATTAFFLMPLAARAFVNLIETLVAGCIWLATSISSGTSVWSMTATAWRTAASSLAAPAASAMLWGLVLVGLLALYWLQRLFGSAEAGRLERQEGE
jgi:hypothetical protein